MYTRPYEWCFIHFDGPPLLGENHDSPGVAVGGCMKPMSEHSQSVPLLALSRLGCTSPCAVLCNLARVAFPNAVKEGWVELLWSFRCS